MAEVDGRALKVQWENVRELMTRDVSLCRTFWGELERCVATHAWPDRIPPELFGEPHIRAGLAESLAEHLRLSPYSACKHIVRRGEAREALWEQATFILQARWASGRLSWTELKVIFS